MIITTIMDQLTLNPDSESDVEFINAIIRAVQLGGQIHVQHPEGDLTYLISAPNSPRIFNPDSPLKDR